MPEQSTDADSNRQYTEGEIKKYTDCLQPIDHEGDWTEWVRYSLAAPTADEGVGSQNEIVRSLVEKGRKIWESRQKAVSKQASNSGNTAVPPTVPEDDKTAQPPSNTRQPSQQTDASKS